MTHREIPLHILSLLQHSGWGNPPSKKQLGKRPKRWKKSSWICSADP